MDNKIKLEEALAETEKSRDTYRDKMSRLEAKSGVAEAHDARIERRGRALGLREVIKDLDDKGGCTCAGEDCVRPGSHSIYCNVPLIEEYKAKAEELEKEVG